MKSGWMTAENDKAKTGSYSAWYEFELQAPTATDDGSLTVTVEIFTGQFSGGTPKPSEPQASITDTSILKWKDWGVAENGSSATWMSIKKIEETPNPFFTAYVRQDVRTAPTSIPPAPQPDLVSLEVAYPTNLDSHWGMRFPLVNNCVKAIWRPTAQRPPQPSQKPREHGAQG